MDSRFKEHKNCEISGVYKKIMGTVSLNEYLIEISEKVEGKFSYEYTNLKLSKSNLYEELMELISGKRERIYASHGMADIDIYKNKNKYCIEWSPSDTSYHFFYFDEKDFINNFVKSLES